MSRSLPLAGAFATAEPTSAAPGATTGADEGHDVTAFIRATKPTVPVRH